MSDIPGFFGPMCDWPEVQAVPNAKEALKNLSRTSKCHLATNAADSTDAQIRAALARADLDLYITNIYSFRSVGFPKPLPHFFDYILNDLDVDRSSVIMVGDSLQTDILSAEKCGLKAIWYNPDDLPVPDRVQSVRNLLDLSRR